MKAKFMALVTFIFGCVSTMANAEPLWEGAEVIENIVMVEGKPNKFWGCKYYDERILNGVCGSIGLIFKKGSGAPIELGLQELGEIKIGQKYNIKIEVVGVLPVSYGRNSAEVDTSKINILYKIKK